MKAELRHRARHKLDQRLSGLSPERLAPPPKGWIRAIRDSLGMTGSQLAARLKIRPPSLVDLEKSEATGAIQLKTLSRVAEALDCTLVYALVPKTSLEDAVQTRARKIALRDLKRVAHTMKLEDQSVENGGEDQIQTYIRSVLKDRDLWAGND